MADVLSFALKLFYANSDTSHSETYGLTAHILKLNSLDSSNTILYETNVLQLSSKSAVAHCN